jgi:transcriptional regulator with XRE-family HTH domain
MTSKIATKLEDPAYRGAFVASQINIGIPFQIRALLKARGWTQEKLAERTGMLQPRISAILKPGKVRPNIETLRRIAEGFDCGLLVRFAPFSELVRWSDSFDPERFNIPSFADDPFFKKPATKTAAEPARLTGLTNALPENYSLLFRVALEQAVNAIRGSSGSATGLAAPPGSLQDLASVQYTSAFPPAFAPAFAPAFDQTCSTPTPLVMNSAQSTRLQIVSRNTGRWRTIVQGSRKGVNSINARGSSQERTA